MLVRSSALGRHEVTGAGNRVLAACPDTDERGDPWRWTVSLVQGPDGPEAAVVTDDSFLAASERRYSGGESRTILRPAGQVLVVTVLRGQALVAAANGPWERWIRPEDVFVLEGEDDEELRISLDGDDSLATAFHLLPTGDRALRWVP